MMSRGISVGGQRQADRMRSESVFFVFVFVGGFFFHDRLSPTALRRRSFPCSQFPFFFYTKPTTRTLGGRFPIAANNFFSIAKANRENPFRKFNEPGKTPFQKKTNSGATDAKAIPRKFR